MSIPTTNEIRIETSTHCNAGCVFCPWPTDDFTRKKEIMSVDDYKFYVDKVRQELPDQITETTISGFGEAFTDPTLLKKIYTSIQKFGASKIFKTISQHYIHISRNFNIHTKSSKSRLN